jgi:SAM-dependent methyltransferase
MSRFERHNDEIRKNMESWNRKPVLRAIYDEFYSLITGELTPLAGKKTVEIGSGVGNLKRFLPDCICTDVFDNPWIDRVENAYRLSFRDGEVANLILFDVWHHLEFPVAALQEFYRTLAPGGRLVIFEPCISLLGWIVYGIFHPESVGWFRKINLSRQAVDPEQLSYYAAQGNAGRFFQQKKYRRHLSGFSVRKIMKIPAIAYVLSGGYSRKQLFSDRQYARIKKIESLLLSGVSPLNSKSGTPLRGRDAAPRASSRRCLPPDCLLY